MSKKKTNTAEVQEAAVKNAPKKKMSKKEKKALAEQQAKEMNRKKLNNYGMGFIISLGAVAISFLVKAEAGTPEWSYIQIGCYMLMGVAGSFLRNGAKYESTPKRAKTMGMIGLTFMAVCVGMVLAEFMALLI